MSRSQHSVKFNDSAVKMLGDETLKMIARELVQAVRNNVTIDWTLKESIQAKLRVMVKRVLRKHGYPPDKEKKATETVLEQAALLCKDWAEKPVAEEKSDLFFSDVIPDGNYEEGYLPIYDLQAVATAFKEQPTPNIKGWKPMPDKRHLKEDMFIAQVVGKSMEATIPDNSWCLFRPDQGGSRNGKIVLVESRHIADPETMKSYTIKRYFSEKIVTEDTFRHIKIILRPDNKVFKDIVLENVPGDDFCVVAEFIAVLA